MFMTGIDRREQSSFCWRAAIQILSGPPCESAPICVGILWRYLANDCRLQMPVVSRRGDVEDGG